MQKFGRVAPKTSIVTKLWYCDITRGSDIVTEQERSLAVSARPRPSHRLTQGLQTFCESAT